MRSKKLRVINILIMIIMSMVYILPAILNSGVTHFYNQDTIFHLSRIQGLSNVLRSPVNFMSFGHHGTIMNLFYPWITIYPAFILFKVLGSLVAAYKLFYLLVTFLTMLIAYFSMFQIKKNDVTALFFSLFYTFATYRSADIFKRAAMGESVALTFMPLVLLGCYYLMKTDYKKWYVLTLGMTLVMYSHLLSVAMISAMIAIIILTTFYFWDQKFERIKYIGIATCATILTSLGAIVPLVEESIYTELKVPPRYELRGIDLDLLITNTLNSNVFSYEIGLVLFIGIFFTIAVIIFKRTKLDSTDNYIFFLGFIAFVLMGSYFPWHIFNNTPITSIQFVFRIAVFVNLFISYGFAIAITPIKKFKMATISKIVMALVFIGTVHTLSIINLYKTETNKQKLLNRETIVQKSGDYFSADYSNVESLGKKEVQQNLFIINDTNIVEVKTNITDSVYTFVINNNFKNGSRLSTPIFRYKGQITKVNGREVISSLSKFGTTEIRIPKGKSTITIQYNYSTIAKAAYFTSTISFFVIIIYAFYITLVFENRKIASKHKKVYLN